MSTTNTFLAYKIAHFFLFQRFEIHCTSFFNTSNILPSYIFKSVYTLNMVETERKLRCYPFKRGGQKRGRKHFFVNDVLPNIRGLLESTKIDEHEALQLFTMFTKMDKNKDGTLSCAEFHKVIGIEHSLISERLWIFLTKCNCPNSTITFHQFVGVVSCLNNLGLKDFGMLVFRIFDIDMKDIISIWELDALIRMVHNSDEADAVMMQNLRGYLDKDHISLQGFIEAIQQKPEIVKPLLLIQTKLRGEMDK